MQKVIAAIIIHEQKVLIAQRPADDRLPLRWEFPGGKLEPGETPEACLKREIWEEFGIGIDVDKCLGAHVHHYDHGSIKLMAYRAYWISGQIKSTFHAAYQWVALSGLSQFELCAADIPFLEKIAGARIFGQA